MAAVISDASEIQFWATGVDSFNEKAEGYTDDYCFFMKRQCSSTVRLQIFDTEDKHYVLKFYDENEVVVQTLYYTQIDLNGTPAVPGSTDAMVIPSLDTWLTRSTSPTLTDWIVGISNPYVSTPTGTPLDPSISEKLYAPYSFVEGNEYTITVNYTKAYFASGFNPRAIRINILDSSFNTVSSHSSITPVPPGGSSSISYTFTAAGFGTYIGIDTNHATATTITIDSITGTVTTPAIPAVPGDRFLNTLSFSGIDFQLCDQRIKFKIFDQTDLNTELFHSDAVLFVSVWENSSSQGRVDIQFKSIVNFADLIYDEYSEYFMLQLDGRFRKEQKITQQKVLELTEKVINTASSVKIKKRLVLDDLTDYMHTKICLALAHASSGSVLIDGKEWVQADEYEEGDRPDTYPLTPAEVLLTEKNYFKHNVI